MPVQLISYDLSQPGQDYSELHEAIQALGSWWHCLESVWIVTTAQSSSAVLDALLQHLDQNDKLVVLELQGDWASYNLSKQCVDWLNSNL
jgi:hypothetical protein